MFMTEWFSEMACTICETMIPGIVSDELGPATTIDGPFADMLVAISLNSLRSRTTTPKPFLNYRSKNPESIS
jgi:hypothetical protein